MTETETTPARDDQPIPRRGMLTQVLTGALGAIVAVVPLIPGLAFFLAPLRKKEVGGATSAGGGKTDADGFIRMAVTFSALPEDGTPQQYTVLDDKTDAWNRFVNVPVGSVWLRRIMNNIVAFNTVCPHLGCAVGHRPSEGDFFCPCHTSAFDLDGKRTNEVPPRDMDVLEIRRKTDGVVAEDGEEIWIRFENYRAATSEKIPV